MKIHYLIKMILLFLGIIISYACSHQVTLNPTLTPSSFVAKRFPCKVAVSFSPDMYNYTVTASPSSYAGSAHTYNFEIGKSLCQPLIKSCETAYVNVVEDNNPIAGQYDRIIKFSLANSNMDIHFTSGFASHTAKANYTVSVLMETYDGKQMKLLNKMTVTGNGFVAQPASGFTADKVFAKAIENGIQQVSDNAANLLISGIGEPKEK